MIDHIIKILETNLEEMNDTSTCDIDKFRKLLENTPELVALLEEKPNQRNSPELRQSPALSTCKILAVSQGPAFYLPAALAILKTFYNPNLNYDIVFPIGATPFAQTLSPFINNIDDYSVIIVDWQVNQNIVTGLTVYKDIIARWINCGGTIISQSTNNATNPYGYLPLSVNNLNTNDTNTVIITDPTSPLMNNLTNATMSGWNNSIHAVFGPIDPAFKTITTNPAAQPATILAQYGNGNIIVTGHDFAFHVIFGPFAAILFALNLIDFACSGCKQCCCPEANPQLSCQVVLKHETQLVPPALMTSVPVVTRKLDVRIEKVIAEKILICGVLHKKITYNSVDDCGNPLQGVVRCDDVPFSCFIDIPCENCCSPNAPYEINAAIEDVVYSRVACFGKHHSTGQLVGWKYVEKEVIKVTVKKAGCAGTCP
ncbi:DUF3794 domain-containing protein [Clostridium sp.]|uniref:DUF3794 domain-containing protein n=1 Tax=Clostridium sp. TaxID=1506 RepID=UPI0032169621